MLGIHFLEKDTGLENFGISAGRLGNSAYGEFCVSIDSTISSAVKIALGAVATAFSALYAPFFFGAMLTMGYFFKQSFDWIVRGISQIWNSPTHHHDGLPCRDRQMAMGFLAASITFFVPALTAAFAGQYFGGLLNQFVESDLEESLASIGVAKQKSTVSSVSKAPPAPSEKNSVHQTTAHSAGLDHATAPLPVDQDQDQSPTYPPLPISQWHPEKKKKTTVPQSD